MYRLKKGTTPETTEGKELACKVVPLSQRTTGEKNKDKMADFKNELFVLVKSKHRNIVGIKDHLILNNRCYLMMEYANGGNLSEECKKKAPYPQIKAKRFWHRFRVLSITCTVSSESHTWTSNWRIFSSFVAKGINKTNTS